MRINCKPLIFLPGLLLLGMAACKKDKFATPTGSLEAKEYTWNVALKGFQPDPLVAGTISTSFNMKTLYYYLQRTGKSDTLIQLDFPKGQQSYDFSVKPEVWPAIDLQDVKGLKLLAVQDNNTSLEQVIKITYFNPAAPVLKDLPETVTPSLTGTTTITGKAESSTGLSKIYFYDNGSGNFEAIDSVLANGSKDIAINYNYTYTLGAGQLKVTAVDIYGLKVDHLIQFTNIPFKPVIAFDADTLRVAFPDGKPAITGTLKSYTALASTEAYIVTASGETLHGTVTPVLISSSANEYNYTFSITDFPYAAEVTECKLVAKDGTNSSNAGSVPMKELPYYRWNNLTMMSQGTANFNSPSCFFIGEPDRPTLSACEVVNDASLNAKVDFAIFTNSAFNLAFNNPANISTSTLGTFRCNGVSWSPATPSSDNLKKTVFRVLGPANAAETAIYNKYNDNTITELGNAFFAGVSAPSANAPNTTTFDNTKLIWAKMTPVGGGTTRNILMKVQQVDIVSTSGQQGTSTVTIDILKEK